MRKTKVMIHETAIIEPDASVAVSEPSLEDRVRAAFYDSARSETVAPLLTELQAACGSAGQRASESKRRALDPRLGGDEVKARRAEYLDLQFEHERLQVAFAEISTRLELLRQAEAAAEAARVHRELEHEREKMYDGFCKVASAVRDLANAVHVIQNVDQRIAISNANSGRVGYISPVLHHVDYAHLEGALANLTHDAILRELWLFNSRIPPTESTETAPTRGGTEVIEGKVEAEVRELVAGGALRPN